MDFFEQVIQGDGLRAYMFAYLQGSVISSRDSILTLAVGGVGFSLLIARAEQFEIGKEVKIITYIHWMQDQGPVLYGFFSEFERDIFLLVLSCSGMGPKIGLAVLSQLSPLQFIQIVQEGNEKTLSSVNGIGPKKAEQMIVQLRHKVGKLVAKGLSLEGSAEEAIDYAALESWKNLSGVLQSLNYSRTEIDAALAHARNKISGKEYVFDELLRSSLSFLAKRL